MRSVKTFARTIWPDNIECQKCGQEFSTNEHTQCPRCKEENDFENGPWKEKRVISRDNYILKEE